MTITALRITTSRAYEIVAFVTGFSLMVFELVASRMLAPTIGSSTYIWTSVIGVIIAALSIGYAIGGRVADKRVQKLDISWLLLATAASITFALAFAPDFLQNLGNTTLDARFKGLFASLILFMPASFVLGVISPYLVRLHTDSITEAGRSVASLSALNAVGGIIGTFSAGFIFFGTMGARETLVLVITLLVATSWLIQPRRYWKIRLGVIVACGLICMQALVVRATPNTIASIDTPSAHYEVIRATMGGREINALLTGTQGWQSGVYIDDPTSLAFDYTRGIAEVIAAAPKKDRMLMLGGGAFTLPQHLATTYPHTHIDAVEIDPQLATIAKEHFQYQSPKNVTIIADDARAFLGYTKQTYDIIIVDVYSDVSVPFAVATTEYTAALKSHLQPGGAVVVNMIGSRTASCEPLLGSLHASYMTHFTHYSAQPTQDMLLKTSQNIITTYSNSALKWLSDYTSAELPQGRILTDNYAPIERLSYQCWQSQ